MSTPRSFRSRGFTLVEMVVIAPIVILSISAFIAVIVSMTGEVLSSRGSNSLAYDVQDSLNRIEQDIKLSTTFLAENSISFTAANPQGAGDHGSTTNFANVNSSGNTVLVLGALVTNGNPVVAGTGSIYIKDTPNDCSSATLYSKNTPLVMNIIYFIDDKGDTDPFNDTLWRRTVMPLNYTDTANLCGGTPWQQPSCKPGFSSSFCKTDDMKLLEGLVVADFVVQYYSSASAASANTVSSDPLATTDARNAALRGIQTAAVSLTAKKSIAGRAVERTGTMRATRLDTNATAIAEIITPDIASLTPSVTSSVVDGSDVLFSWSQLPGAVSYSADYKINGGSWVAGPTNLTNAQRSYKVTAANHNDTVEVRVRGTNANSQLSAYGTNSVQIPVWATMILSGVWRSFDPPYTLPAYTMTSSGQVLLKGMVRSGSGIIANLPAKYRPGLGKLIFMNASTGAFGRIDLWPNGDIVPNVYTNTWVSLDGIMFMPGSTGFTSVSTHANGWVNYSPSSGDTTWAPVSYKTDASGRTSLQGLVRAGSVTSNTPMFTLPAANMPGEYLHVPQIVTANGSHVSVQPSTSSVVYKAVGANTYVSVSMTYFPTSRAAGVTCTTQWCPLSLTNSWAHFGNPYATPTYTKASDGVVHLKGMINGGTVGTTMATLPAGYCPKERLLLAAVSADTFGRVDIAPQSNGTCYVVGVAVSATWVSLDGIHFLAE